MRLDELYQEIILDHWRHPRGQGLRSPELADGGPGRWGESYQVNPTCGDEVTLRVVLDGDPDGPGVADVSYEAIGCSISQASASVLHELLTGRPLAEALAVQQAFTEMIGGRGQVEPDEKLLEDAVAFAGVAQYPARIKCALMAWLAFKDAAARATVDGGGAS